MFCLMDVSGSMDEGRKELSKRFFILLYLFLTRHYEKIDIVFIRHHTQAQEVDEQNFFHATETGGTVVSQRAGADGRDHPRALQPAASGTSTAPRPATATTGTTTAAAAASCWREKILPLCRYYAYVQVAEQEQNLWEEYTQLLEANRRSTSRCARPPAPTRSTRCSATCSRRKGRRPHERLQTQITGI
jgi:hypothetical protein